MIKFSKHAFYLSLIATLLIPTTLIFLQYCKVGYSISIQNDSHWQGITDTFSFQIEITKILGGLTAMFGLLYRSAQTQVQIEHIEKSDNFKFYMEHRVFIHDRIEKENGDTLIDKDLAYAFLYPNNSVRFCPDLENPNLTNKNFFKDWAAKLDSMEPKEFLVNFRLELMSKTGFTTEHSEDLKIMCKSIMSALTTLAKIGGIEAETFAPFKSKLLTLHDKI